LDENFKKTRQENYEKNIERERMEKENYKQEIEETKKKFIPSSTLTVN
jgi:hypothetical protein